MANRVLVPDRQWPRAVAVPAWIAWLRRLAEREALPIVVIALWVSLLTIELPLLLGPDTWFSLVGGRYVAQHGLPHTDTLTFWTLGRPWINQQWGGQLALFEASAHGGVRAALLLGVACIGAALILVGAATRHLGASARSAAIGVALPLLGAPWFAQVRAQSFALPLFVAIYALLATDSRRPTRRVLLTIPLLVLWANIHGSVALGAGLVALYGLTLARRSGARRRAALLIAGAPLTLLASPYGFKLVSYYHVMLLRPPLARYVTEWQPPAVSSGTALLFASIIGGAALFGGHRRRLTSFERWALVLLLLAALSAIRNGVWFELALGVAFPRLLDGAWPSRIELTTPVRRVNLGLSCLAVAGVVAAFAAQAAKPSAWILQGHTPEAAAAITTAAGSNGYVIADELDSDWLLWAQPSLAGRLAYDVRFEFFNAREVKQIDLLDRDSRPVWHRCGSRARVVVFPGERLFGIARREGVLAQGARAIFRSPTVVAVQQPSVSPFCAL